MSSSKKTSVKLFPIFNYKQRKTIKVLPAELLEMVFKKLPPEDLVRVMLVCKQWKKATENPELWTGVCFERKGHYTRDKVLLKMMTSKRFEAVQNILLCNYGPFVPQYKHKHAPDMILEAILHHKGLRKMSIADGSVKKAEPKLLAQVLVKMEEVVIWDDQMTVPQKEAFFVALQKPNSLKKLQMHKKNATLGGISLDLPSVAPDFIAQATQNIEKLDMKMTSLEATFVINIILKGSSSVKSLYLRHKASKH